MNVCEALWRAENTRLGPRELAERGVHLQNFPDPIGGT